MTHSKHIHPLALRACAVGVMSLFGTFGPVAERPAGGLYDRYRADSCRTGYTGA